MKLTEKLLENYQLKGDILSIHTYPDPILSKKCNAVKSFDNELYKLCQNMLFTMYHAPGIGLAAPQVGANLNLFVLDVDYKRESIVLPDGREDYKVSKFNPHVFINPKLKSKDGEIIYEEGCLSLPGVYEDVKRYENIVLEYFNLDGEKEEISAKGILSICIQHEFDHLEGIVFIERLSSFKKNFFKKKLTKEKLKSKAF